MSYYTGVGDYYSGKGDPGLFGSIGSIFKKGLGIAGSILPGPVGTAARAIGGLIPGTRPTRPSYPGINLPSQPRPTIPGIGRMPQDMGRGVPIRASQVDPTCNIGCPTGSHRHKGGQERCVRNRRVNYTNPKALSRAAKRLDGFVGVARKAMKSTNYKVVSKSYKQNWRKPLKK